MPSRACGLQDGQQGLLQHAVFIFDDTDNVVKYLPIIRMTLQKRGKGRRCATLRCAAPPSTFDLWGPQPGWLPACLVGWGQPAAPHVPAVSTDGAPGARPQMCTLAGPLPGNLAEGAVTGP